MSVVLRCIRKRINSSPVCSRGLPINSMFMVRVLSGLLGGGISPLGCVIIIVLFTLPFNTSVTFRVVSVRATWEVSSRIGFVSRVVSASIACCCSCVRSSGPLPYRALACFFEHEGVFGNVLGAFCGVPCKSMDL